MVKLLILLALRKSIVIALMPGIILEIAILQFCDRFELLDYLYLVSVRSARWGPRGGERFDQKTEMIGEWDHLI